MKTSIWTATAVVVLVSTVIAWLCFNSAHTTHVALVDVSIQRTAVAAEISNVRDRMATAERNLADLRAALKAAQTESKKQAALAGSAKPGTARPPNLVAVLEAHPELRGLFRQNFRAKMRQNYQPFYNAARLTSEQRQKFEDLMLDNEEQKMDLQATAQMQGLTTADPAIAKMRQQMDEKLQSAQTELLGAAGCQQLQDFKRVEPQNKFVSDIVSQVALTSSPFTVAQREQLLNVLATSVRDDAGGSANAKDNSTSSVLNTLLILSKTTDWPRVMAQVQIFLSPTQLSALKGNAAVAEAPALIREFCQREGISARP